MSHIYEELLVILQQALETDVVIAEFVKLLGDGLLRVAHLTVLVRVGFS